MPGEEKMSKSPKTNGSGSPDGFARQERERTLSVRDRDIFLALIDNPPEPNVALRKAAARYTKRVNK